MSPCVTFVVPCYKLGHLLGECVESILSQSFEEFEILIMDDCSPDATPEVARSFGDPRVVHLRNRTNLGHLRNYNEGIARARGDYIWLISADDRLQRPYVLERFVRVLRTRPNVGFVFCPAMKIRAGVETDELIGSYAPRDAVFRGREFAKALIEINSVPAPAGMVRRSCYGRLGLFPLDLPFAGDWYLWLLFALHYDVGYLAEPMVGYRIHSDNMTNDFGRRPRLLMHDEIAVRWRIHRLASEMRLTSIVRACRGAIAEDYARRLVRKAAHDWAFGMTAAQFLESLRAHAADRREEMLLRAMVHAAIGDHRYWNGDYDSARSEYSTALDAHVWLVSAQIKRAMLAFGNTGIGLRNALTRTAQQATKSHSQPSPPTGRGIPASR